MTTPKDWILNIFFFFFLGKFAQRSNLSKVEQIEDPQVFFDYLTSDEITVLDAILVSDEIMEIRYEYGDKFVQPNPRTNVVIAAFTTCSVCAFATVRRARHATGTRPVLRHRLGHLS